MASKWNLRALGELVQNFDSQRVPLSSREREKRRGLYPYYGATNIMDHVDDFLFEGLHLLVGEDGSVERPDGKPFLQLVDGKFWVNNHAHVLRGATDEDTRFLYYSLSTVAIRPYMSGSVQAKLSQANLNRILTPYPPNESDRRAITHILGTLDDKIELNRKQNETLEAMARALFKAWFVDFEPVRAKMEGRWQHGQSLPGLPAHLYDLLPDRLVESELGEIPEGWRFFAFSDVAQQSKGSVNPGNTPEDIFTHYSLPAFDSAQAPVIELGGAIKSNKTPVPDTSVLVSKLNPHIPRIWHVGKAGANAVCSTEFIVWTPKAPASSAFLFCLATSQEFNSAMRQLVTGTSNSHQRVKPEQLGDIRVFAACEKAIAAFSELVRISMEQVLQNRMQSRSLAQLRDTLLPKLISGELRIADAEKFLGGVGL
jgi:type I restriction enzyme S subunit